MDPTERFAVTPSEPDSLPEPTDPTPAEPVPVQPVASSNWPPSSGWPSAPGAPASSAPGSPSPQPPRGVGTGTIVMTALLSAILASGGTLAILEGSGTLRPAAAGAVASASPGLDDGKVVRIDESSAVVDAAARVGPAVVQITASGVTSDPFGGSIPEQGVGSGIIFDSSGWVLTNHHVVQTSDNQIASKLTVELKDGHQYTGTVYGIDTLTDLAIVKIDATGLPAAPIGASADIKVGELAIAIGSPLGTYSNSVTSGIISGTGRSITVDSGVRLNNLIQTDAAINPGNSGGPLLDAAGDVIGINTAMAQGSSGIGFAIPIDIARPIMSQALAGKPLARPYLGVRFETIDPQVKAEQHLSVDQGALLVATPDQGSGAQPAIAPDGPAAAGLKEGDVIVAVESQSLDEQHPLDLVVSGYSPGQTVSLTVRRGSDTLTLKITLGTRPAS